MLGCVTQCS